MSKTVIVFSTYYNNPIGEDYLFSKGSAIPGRFTSQKLCDYFWRGVINDSLINAITENLSDYMSEEALDDLTDGFERIVIEREKKIMEFIHTYENKLQELCEKENIEFSVGKYDWIDNLIGKYLISNMGNGPQINNDSESDSKLLEELKELKNNWKSSGTGTYIELLKQQKGNWVSIHLKDDSSQQWFNTYVPDGMNLSSPPCENQPWLSHRFSYYKFNQVEEVPNDVSVYAVWPLRIPSPDDGTRTNEWVDALTDQFLTDDVEELYLILHAKDIEDTTFRVHSIKESSRTIYGEEKEYKRYVALFQHADDIGIFLRSRKRTEESDGTNEDKTIEDIRQFVIKKVSIDHFATQIAEIVAIDTLVDASQNQDASQKQKDQLLLDQIVDLEKKLHDAMYYHS